MDPASAGLSDAPDGTATEVVHALPNGARLILVADTTQTTQVTRQLRQLMIAAGMGTLALAALLLIAVSRVALRPLDRLTALATDIATGDRGRRLRPERTDTDLGRAAAAFDGMLDELETSERRARQAAYAAERAETATRRFLADAAHELRTPIAGIQVAADQLVNHFGREHEERGARSVSARRAAAGRRPARRTTRDRHARFESYRRRCAAESARRRPGCHRRCRSRPDRHAGSGCDCDPDRTRPPEPHRGPHAAFANSVQRARQCPPVHTCGRHHQRGPVRQRRRAR